MIHHTDWPLRYLNFSSIGLLIPWSVWLRDVGVLPVDIVEIASECQEGQHQQKHQSTKTEVGSNSWVCDI